MYTHRSLPCVRGYLGHCGYIRLFGVTFECVPRIDIAYFRFLTSFVVKLTCSHPLKTKAASGVATHRQDRPDSLMFIKCCWTNGQIRF